MSWISRLVNAFRPVRTATDLDEEFRLHIDQREDDPVRGGMTRWQLGNAGRLRESGQEIKSWVWLESLLRDFRFGFRMIVKYRTASMAAIVSLALALGACTAAFTLVDALVFRPLPVEHPNQLISLARLMPAFLSPTNQPHESDSFSYPQYELLRTAAGEQADLFAMTLSGGLQTAQFDHSEGAGENVRVESLSGGGFAILGVKPAMGRLIQAADDSPGQGHFVAVLSYSFWKRRFGGDPSAIGRWVTLDGKSYQISGIASRFFGGVQPGYRTDVWIPLSMAADARVLSNPDGGNFQVWGRVRDEAQRSALHEHLQAALINSIRDRVRINPPRNLQGAQLQQFTDAPLRMRDASSGADSLFRLQFRQPLWILALISALLLLIACTNVANLMLARASARAHEMALRVSLGAARSRLIRQMMIESGQIAAAACVLGLMFAALIAPAVVVRLGPSEFPAWLEVTPDVRTLSFTVLVSGVTALLFGVVPALRASSTSPDAALKAGVARHSGHSGPLRWILTAEISFSVAVLFLAGLLLFSFRKLIAVDLGFAPDGVALFDLAPRQKGDSERQSGAELLAHLRGLPGVEAAGISQQRPMGGDRAWIMMPFVRLPGRAVEAVRPVEVPVSAGFFGAMRIRWIAGRDFLPEEVAATSEAVVVNQAFVDKFFRGQNPIGQRFDKLTDDPDPVRQQIVGVVGNARYNNLREPERPFIYTPLRDAAGTTLNIRTRAGDASLIPSLRKEIEVAAPRLMVRGSILLPTQIDDTMNRERLLALLAGFFSVIALLLAGVGLYGVMNYSAVRRTREIGIRLALGARRGAVVGLMVSDALLIVAIGLGAGITGGIGLGRYLASQLFGVKATDFWSLTAPVVCLVLVTAGAVLPPALRAAKADPLVALRHE